MLTTREKGLIRPLMYPVQFQDNPVESVEHVIRHVVQSGSLNASQEEYFMAIKNALSSDEDLADLLPSDLEEPVVREYLGQVEVHLAISDPAAERAIAGKQARVGGAASAGKPAAERVQVNRKSVRKTDFKVKS